MPISVRLIIFFAGIVLFVAVFELVRKKKFREELSIIWLFFAVTVAASSVIDLVVDPLARILKIAYPPALVFMIIGIVLIISVLYFSVVTSDIKSRVKEMTQRIALLEFEMKKERQGKTEKNC